MEKLRIKLVFSKVVFFCIILGAQSGQLIPEYFRSPVDYTYSLSGNFCELRESHFHAGIDIKPSTGGGKDKIYSIGNGYISRIRVSAGGYGRAIYIDHPDVGYTSVYAHLEIFDPYIENHVKQYQITQESFEVDFLPEPHVFPVKKGDVIGLMGNTGFSFGKHLHFEIRDTKTENPVNPYLFGMSVADNTPPSVLSLAIHGLDDDFHKMFDLRLPVETPETGIIYIDKPILVPASRAGLAVITYDKSDGVYNKLGIYGFHMYVDDSLTYSYHLDKVSFDQTRQIIGFYDFETKKRENKTYTLCYKYPGNDMEFLRKSGSGIIDLHDDKDRTVRMEIEDFRRNRKTLMFLLRRSEETQKKELQLFMKKVYVGETINLQKENLFISFRENSIFRNIHFNLETNVIEGKETQYKIHDSSEPIKTPIEIGIKPEYPISGKMDKATIILTNGNKRKINYGGKWKDGFLTTKIREFGTFKLDYDTIAPSIRSINFSAKVVKKRTFRFKIGDNMSVRGEDVDQMTYKVWINNNFTISPYSSKTGILDIPIGDLRPGNHLLRIEARDHSGNLAIFTSNFIKK